MRAKTIKKIFIFVLLIMFNILTSPGQNDTSAIENIKADKYAKTLDYYHTLLAKGNYSVDLFFNMGNEYFNKKDYPHAVLYYEKALRVSPFDSEIKHNLSVANRHIDSEIVKIPDFFLLQKWRNFVMMFSLDLWAYISIFTAIVSVIFLCYKWFRNPVVSSIWFWIIFLIFTVSVSAAAYNYNFNFKQITGILMKKEHMFSAPEQRSERLYELTGGEKLRVIDSLENWYRVELINKERGWIVKENIEKI